MNSKFSCHYYLFCIPVTKAYSSITVTILDITHRALLYLLGNKVSETEFYLRLQEEFSGPETEIALSTVPNFVHSPEDADRIQSHKHNVLNKRQDCG
jgi:hypothetical protein